MNLLEVKNLSLGFNNLGGFSKVLDSIDFEIPENSILGIVGESGSGKTLTALSILKLLDSKAEQCSGEILFQEDGQITDLARLSEKQIRTFRGRKIGMVFQEPMSSLNPLLSCGFQVSEGLLAHKMGNSKEIKDRVMHCFDLVGLKDLDRIYKSYPFQLSGGQLQRVLIALAISCSPKLIIADEPTTALDVSLQQHIIDLLKKLNYDLNISILFISHDLNVIKKLCNDVLVMYKGQIVERGPVNSVFNSPIQEYTKALLSARPPLNKKLNRLLTKEYIEKNLIYNKDEAAFSVLTNEQIKVDLEKLLKQDPLIQLEHVHIKYPLKSGLFGLKKQFVHAVKDVNLTILEGEVLGLVGESGSGKSSVGKAILNLAPVSEGIITYRKRKLNKLDSNQWKLLRKDMQLIFQDPYSALDPKQSIGEAILEPILVHQLFSNKKTARERVYELLLKVGLKEDQYNRYPHQFSGGQRQRICIARALALEPKFLVCDEPVSALDVSVQAQILNLLKDLRDEFKLSMLFITHDMSVVRFLADRIAVMHEGSMVEYGNCEQIINDPQHEYTKQLIEAIPVF
ncbi:MAG TPA: ABC transporter ATP-binding protein [Saprospiraceae bacterium]|nr:ABC transporter ATP-binding protein [Saprospiraceae bacterium]